MPLLDKSDFELWLDARSRLDLFVVFSSELFKGIVFILDVLVWLRMLSPLLFFIEVPEVVTIRVANNLSLIREDHTVHAV